MSRFVALLDAGEDEADHQSPINSTPNTPVDSVEANLAAYIVEADSAASPSSPPPLVDPIFWVDLEMSGLDLQAHTILEVAVIASDGTLDKQLDGPCLCIHHDEDVLTSMNDWSRQQHEKTGLTERCRESTVSLADAEDAVIEFVKLHQPAGRPAILGGACVYTDLAFIEARMPRLRELLSHRVVDVSTVRELARRWQPNVARNAPKSENGTAHRALDDIRYSIQELRYFRDACFKPMELKGRRRDRSGRRNSPQTAKKQPSAEVVLKMAAQIDLGVQ